MGEAAQLRFAAVLAAALAVGNAAALTCDPPEGFAKFLARYQSDTSFQHQRIGPRLAVIDYAGREDQDVRRERVTRASFMQKAYARFPDKAWIAQEQLQMTIKMLSPGKADAHVFAPASDSFSRHYRFTRRHGCWRLTEFMRDSL